MKPYIEKGVVAFDGTRFTGEKCVEECIRYEKDHYDKLMKKLKGHIIIKNCECTNKSFHQVHDFFKVLDETGVHLLKEWMGLAYHCSDMMNYMCGEIEINEWYEIENIDGKFHIFRSLNQKMLDIKETINKLNDDAK